MSTPETVRPSGHLQVKGARGGRAFYALVRDGEGRHQRRLGPAWVKDSGRRTPRGAVKWVARDGSKPDGYLTPADAEQLLRELLAAAPKRRVEPRRSRAASMTLREACEHWLRWAQADREIKRSTLGDYGNMCDRICRDLGERTRVATITSEALQEWIDEMRAERRLSPEVAKRRRADGVQIRRLPDGTHVQLTPASSRTKRKYIVAVNGIMKRAVKQGAMERNPAELVDRPGRVRKRRTLATSQFLRPAEVHALLRAAEVKRQDAVMFMVAAFCGLRLGELLDLRWRAVNFEGSALHVESSYVRNNEDTPKSGVRTVPMAPEVASALRRHAELAPAKATSSLVFVGTQGRHVDGNDLRARYYEALERAGLKRIRIHDLRHTFGTVCAAKGIPLTTIKEWMGHVDLATTEIYTAFYPQAADAARISAAFAEEQSAIL